MHRKPLFWSLVSLLCLGAGFYFWRLGDELARKATPPATSFTATNKVSSIPATKASPHALAAAAGITSAPKHPSPTNQYPYRLTNTGETVGQLIRNDKAILLANALIDTTKPLNLTIPDALRAPAHNGTYVAQAKGVLDDSFRAALRDAGATIISYIPNNAYLVRVSDEGAQKLSAVAQSVLPYEPYYKLDSSLLKLAMEDPGAVVPSALNVTVFPDAYPAILHSLQQMGAIITANEPSPFGPLLKVSLRPGTLADLATLTGVQAVARSYARHQANDLVRPTLGVSADSVTTTNYLGLTGLNVTVNINDSGVDATHPDLAGRIIGSPGTDLNGHGTHVAGTILGSGLESTTVTNAQGSVTNANFRGMASDAKGFVLPFDLPDFNLQTNAASQTNILISNNSWNYGNPAYDIAAASYDAAVRDALPGVSGSQPLLFVFSAGNFGDANDDGTAGFPDTILSPATAKNVITVGATELPRFITNQVVVDGMTNGSSAFAGTADTGIFNDTDNASQVAFFSSRGNVGIDVEGTFGRFKPDVVAPGTFVISDRSSTWDTNAYYNPTNFDFFSDTNHSVGTNSQTPFLFPISELNPLQIIITLVTNSFTGSNSLPTLPIYYVDATANPITTNFLGNNQVTIPSGNIPSLFGGETIFYNVGNNNTKPVNFDVQIEVISTNDVGNFFQVLEQLNSDLGPFYRYESGTSMSAAGVSGLLADVQQFFQQSLNITPSPALMKALLINGSRSISDNYDFATQNPTTPSSQGWGMPHLPNIIPLALTNLTRGNQSTMPLQFVDQSPSGALATGQSQTRSLVLASAAQGQDLRATLVWTDPPGNPIASAKLVNNLILIVSNIDTGEVFYGNDIPSGKTFNQATDTNGPPNIDLINNVQNVFLQGPLSTNYSITVLGGRVNVNAVTGNTNNIVQDYALVVSSGDSSTNLSLFTLNSTGAIFTNAIVTNVQILSNSVPLLNQRVGGNSQFSGTTNGSASQWNFYVFTNTLSATNISFTNVAFVTFFPPNLALPRMGAGSELSPPDINATRYAGADIDLFVSTDSTLTNFNPVAIASAQKSLTRTGSEVVFYTNSTRGQVYYVGVKSEDQMGGQFNLIGFATDIPFSSQNGQGNQVINMNTVPLVIPPGAPTQPGSAFLIGICIAPVQVRKAIVTNNVTCQDFGDYIGSLTQGTASVVLNNHSLLPNVNSGTSTLVYDDSGENEFPGSITSAGPGSLQSFTGINALGTAWIYTIVNDNSLTDTGKINNMTVTLEPQQPSGTSFNQRITGDSWFYGFVDVPETATNLIITIVPSGPPVDLYIQAGNFPTFGSFEDFAVISSAGGSLSVSKFSSPPLNAGRYFFGIFNPNPTAENVNILVQVQLSLAPVQPLNFLSVGNEPLLDDAVTDSTINVGVNSPVVGAEVGVRIDHPRESDLVLTLISPSGTRVLLAENRGGLDANGYGSGVNATNTLPSTQAGNASSNTNTISTGTNFGTLNIAYNFFTVPDDMQVFYDGVRILDSRLINGSGTFSVNFGPGNSTSVDVVMNAPGTNPSTNQDAWNYTVAEVTQNTVYATFTENTNLTTTPIKFATPPFGGAATFIPPTNVMTSSFETATLAAQSNLLVDGWSVGTNSVTVVSVPLLAGQENGGNNVLALHGGTITRVLPTVAGKSYTLSFVNHGRPSVTPSAWYKAENSFADSGVSAANTGTPVNSPSFTAGEVGDAFGFNFVNNQYVLINKSPSFVPTGSFAIEGWIDTFADLDEAILSRWGDNSHSYHLSVTPNYAIRFALSDTNNQLNTPFQDYDTGNNVIQPNTWEHVAAVFDQVTGTRYIYVNGQLVGTHLDYAGLQIFAGTSLVGIGAHPSLASPGGFFDGLIDEMTFYTNTVSQLQVQDIYAAGSAGKNPVGGFLIVSATVAIGPQTNVIVGIDQWTTNIFTFTAPSNNMLLTIFGNTNDDGFGNPVVDGTLLDNFTLVQNAQGNPANYFLPEESLDKLIGENSKGNWQLEVLDNRVGATNPQPTLVSWQLSLVLADEVPSALPLSHAITATNTVGPNTITYYFVDVPPWASFATNILSANGPVNLLYNPVILPTGTNATDTTLINNTPSGTVTLSTTGSLPLESGQRYFLGIQNTSTNATVTFTIEVDFNITQLTNAVPLTSTVAPANVPQYFQFDVDSNQVATLFQILSSSGNVELVASKGPPLPTTTSFSYLTAVPGTNTQTITVASNSTPVALSAGRWYLGVYNNDTTPVTFTIQATELGQPTIIPLNNDQRFTTNFPPGSAANTFFSFTVNSPASAALFELYNLNGNVDLTLDQGLNNFPYSAPFFAKSANAGTNSEQIVLRTNTANFDNIYYLGVPNNATSNVTFTIHAIVATNGMLISALPISVGVSISPSGLAFTWPTVGGETYQVQDATNLISPINWTVLSTISNAPSPSVTFLDTNAASGPFMFFRIVQVPTP